MIGIANVRATRVTLKVQVEGVEGVDCSDLFVRAAVASSGHAVARAKACQYEIPEQHQCMAQCAADINKDGLLAVLRSVAPWDPAADDNNLAALLLQ